MQRREREQLSPAAKELLEALKELSSVLNRVRTVVVAMRRFFEQTVQSGPHAPQIDPQVERQLRAITKHVQHVARSIQEIE